MMEDGELLITLPLPSAAASPNARSAHWSQRQGAAKRMRGDAHLAAHAAMQYPGAPWKPCWQNVEITAHFHKPSKQAKLADQDNLISSLKAYIDGLQDAGVILNDRGVTWKPPRQFVGPAQAKERKVVLRIRPIE